MKCIARRPSVAESTFVQFRNRPSGLPVLAGQGKTGHLSPLQNRPFPVSGIEASEFYRTLSPD